MLSITGLDVKLQFYWRKKLRRCQPDYVGAVRVSIAPPGCLADARLDRLVFSTPEFFEGGKEFLRLDSFHYHRVTSLRSAIASQRVKRNVLSYRTILGVWRAGIFDYSTGRLKKDEIERRIRYGITSQVEEVLVHHARGTLPVSRQLSEDETRCPDALVLLRIPTADDKRLFSSYA